MTTLLLSSRQTVDNQALWRAAVQRDWTVARAQGIRLPGLDDSEIVIYVESLFAPTIAELTGRRLLDLSDDWLVSLPVRLTRRQILLTTLGQARSLTSPAFVKPPNEKSFTAQVYASGAALPVEHDDNTAVLVSDPVHWDVEFRCFCLDGRVRACSPYLRSGVLAKETDYASSPPEFRSAINFAELVLAEIMIAKPRAVVLDVGQISGQGWAVVEANGAWGSGIYGCDPDAVLDVIRHATIQLESA